MKAVRIHEYGDAGELKLEETPRPQISAGQILVKIRDAGVNPVDWKIREGRLKDRMAASFPLTMGQDFAGEVTELGAGVDRFAVGDRVFGFATGAYAEYAAASVSEVAKMPPSMNFETAASLPTAASTALQLIRDVVKAGKGMTILIHGAAGGVGSFAAQIARHLGAKVIGTAADQDVSYLKSLGVEQAIDYKRERFEEKARELDAVVDLVGGDTLARSYSIVKKGGTLVSTVQQVDESAAKQAGINASSFMMKRSAPDLAEIAKLVDQGVVNPRVSQTMDLAHAKEAQELNETGQSHGKFILKVA
jgi:NADPH:quinone reductase-like Zn-dependent oxidoreductase